MLTICTDTREQLLRAASKSFNKRKKELGLPDHPSREQYEAAFPEVFAFNDQCGLDKAQQVTAESALSRKEFVGVCETATLWAMNVYSNSGYEVFGYVVDSHGRVARFGGSPTYEAMLQDSTYLPNFAQSERDIGTMFKYVVHSSRSLSLTHAAAAPFASSNVAFSQQMPPRCPPRIASRDSTRTSARSAQHIAWRNNVSTGAGIGKPRAIFMRV